MSSLNDQPIRALLEQPNVAIVSTHNADGSILSTIAWVNAQGDELAVNSAVGRKWPTNLQRDPNVTILVYPPDNPMEYVEVRGTATVDDGADEHIDALTQKYMNQDKYPFRAPGEERIKFTIAPEHVRYQKQG
jgi:PPOX class probable F420-dependent enzyme